jgi:hypothetical protein
MGKYRDVFIENDKTLGDSGTEVVELSVVDPISELHIKVKNKNSTTSNKNNPIMRNISKIEVVDGANVIYSLSGALSQSMSYYQRRMLPSMYRQGGPSANQEDHFVLRFGRYLWDKMFALTPQAFRNLQLKITYDFATVNAIGVTGFLTANGKLSVIARLMEDPEVKPEGYMMAKNHYNFTSAASGDERIPLPTDHDYVMMIVRAWEANVKLYTTLSNLKLNIDSDKDVPFDMDSWQLLKWMESEYGLITLEQKMYATTEENIQTWLGVGETAVITPETLSTDPSTLYALANIYGVDSGHLNLVHRNAANNAAVTNILHLLIRGQALNHCFAIPFGNMDDPDTWFKAQGVGDIKAVLTQGNAGASVDVALLQARMYGK